MEETEHVREGLARIEALRRGDAPRARLIEEVRTLLRAGHETLRAEHERQDGERAAK